MKGIVMDICANRAVILKDDGTFAEVADKHYQVGQKIQFSHSRYMTVAACFIFLMITSVTGYHFYHTPYSYLYVDINPSLRLELNYFDQVISCTPLNEDAKNLQVEHGNMEKALESILNECEQMGYLTSVNNEVEINVLSEHKAITDGIQAVSDIYADSCYSITVGKTTKAKRVQAEKLGISVQKLNAIERYSEVFGGEVADNAEKLKDNSAKEINKALIEEKDKSRTGLVDFANSAEIVPSQKTDKNKSNSYQPNQDTKQVKPKDKQNPSADNNTGDDNTKDANVNTGKSEKPNNADKSDASAGKQNNKDKEKSNNGKNIKADKKSDDKSLRSALSDNAGKNEDKGVNVKDISGKTSQSDFLSIGK